MQTINDLEVYVSHLFADLHGRQVNPNLSVPCQETDDAIYIEATSDLDLMEFMTLVMRMENWETEEIPPKIIYVYSTDPKPLLKVAYYLVTSLFVFLGFARSPDIDFVTEMETLHKQGPPFRLPHMPINCRCCIKEIMQ